MALTSLLIIDWFYRTHFRLSRRSSASFSR